MMSRSLSAVSGGSTPPPAGIPFDTIAAPGCYVCNWNGFLLRVPEAMVGAGARPPINLVGGEPLFVTRISSDPDIPVTQARRLARERYLKVSF